MTRHIAYYLLRRRQFGRYLAALTLLGVLSYFIPVDPGPDVFVDYSRATALDANEDGYVDAAVAPPALAGFNTRAGGTEIAVSRPLPITPGVVLAGFNSTKVGTEVAY